ncbi:hypothetical protein Aperf_G00000110383 [Anoplocephala perfoliata]
MSLLNPVHGSASYCITSRSPQTGTVGDGTGRGKLTGRYIITSLATASHCPISAVQRAAPTKASSLTDPSNLFRLASLLSHSPYLDAADPPLTTHSPQTGTVGDGTGRGKVGWGENTMPPVLQLTGRYIITSLATASHCPISAVQRAAPTKASSLTAPSNLFRLASLLSHSPYLDAADPPLTTHSPQTGTVGDGTGRGKVGWGENTMPPVLQLTGRYIITSLATASHCPISAVQRAAPTKASSLTDPSNLFRLASLLSHSPYLDAADPPLTTHVAHLI